MEAYKRPLSYTRKKIFREHWAATQNIWASRFNTWASARVTRPGLRRRWRPTKLALEVYTQEGFPLDWAGTSTIIALQELGEREGNLARLEAAVEAYQKALEVYTQEDFPQDWAGTQNNLGLALQELGEREGNQARLEAAVDAYKRPLRYIRKKIFRNTGHGPKTIWASRFRNWAREGNLARLEAAVDAFKLALELYRQEDFPRGQEPRSRFDGTGRARMAKTQVIWPALQRQRL